MPRNQRYLVIVGHSVVVKIFSNAAIIDSMSSNNNEILDRVYMAYKAHLVYCLLDNRSLIF